MKYRCNDHGLPTIHENGDCTVRRYTEDHVITGATLLEVLKAWGSNDDWEVQRLPYAKSADELLECLSAGDEPSALIAIADLSKTDRRYAALAAKCPKAREMGLL